MIDWEKTMEEFGIEKSDVSVKRRTKVIVICDGCDKRESKKVRSSKEIHDSHKYLCRKCAMNVPETKKRVHKATAKSNKERTYTKETKEKMSKNLKKRWKENKESMCDTISSNMTKKWEDEEYRKNMSHTFKSKWNNKEYRDKISKKSKEKWQNPEYREKLNKIQSSEEYKNKISESGKVVWSDPEYKERMRAVLQKARENQPRVSSLQTTLYSILDDLGVKYYREREDGNHDPETRIGPYEFDCVIQKEDGNKLLIECNGTYWHSFKKKIITDREKARYVDNYLPDCELKVIWEEEFKYQNKVMELIKYLLGITEIELIDFSFDNVVIKKCKSEECKLLLSKYHYLPNAGRGGVPYGAYLNDELIAVCVFSSLSSPNLPYNNKSVRDLSRLCIHPCYQKKNFASWFMSRCIKELDPKYKTIISYCDTTYGHSGSVYKACGFKLDGETKPGYYFASADGWVMSKKKFHSKAKDMGFSEREFAKKLGYRKVKGKKKLRFIYER